jgi:hypothetical protein
MFMRLEKQSFLGYVQVSNIYAGYLKYRKNKISSSYDSTAQYGPWPPLEDQVSVFMTPGDRVDQLYPQVLDTHFSRLLRHAWATVGLLLNPGHHTGGITIRV